MKPKKWSKLPENEENPWFRGYDNNGKYQVALNQKQTTFTAASPKGVFSTNERASIAYTKTSVSSDDYIKIFTNKISLSLKLSSSAEKVFRYLMSKVTYNQDYIMFQLEEVLKFTNYNSPASVYSALYELADNEIIARSTNYQKIYVNPAVLHKGNRFVMIEEICIDDEDQDDKQSHEEFMEHRPYPEHPPQPALNPEPVFHTEPGIEPSDHSEKPPQSTKLPEPVNIFKMP